MANTPLIPTTGSTHAAVLKSFPIAESLPTPFVRSVLFPPSGTIGGTPTTTTTTGWIYPSQDPSP